MPDIESEMNVDRFKSGCIIISLNIYCMCASVREMRIERKCSGAGAGTGAGNDVCKK